MMTPDDATLLAADVELSVEQLDEPAWQRHPKRAKLRPNQAAHDDCREATPTGPPPGKATTDVASVVAEAVKSTVMAVKDELAADRAAAGGSSSHGQVEMVGEAAPPFNSGIVVQKRPRRRRLADLDDGSPGDGSGIRRGIAFTAVVLGGAERVRQRGPLDQGGQDVIDEGASPLTSPVV